MSFMVVSNLKGFLGPSFCWKSGMYLLYDVVSNLMVVSLKSSFKDFSFKERCPNGEFQNYSNMQDADESEMARVD